LHGSDLSVVLQRGPLSVEDAVDFLLQAADAMAEAHAAGIVHRDLKPSNLFMSMRSDGTPIIKVLDFGISKVNVPDTSDAALTRTTTIMGSPFYMSPEQMRSSKDVDHRTDIWSLGVILYELMSGAPPFNGETLPQLVASILSEPAIPIRERRPEVPAELEAVILRCLEKDRNQRFQSVGAMAQALVNFASRRSRLTAERIIRLSGLDVPGSTRDPLVTGSAFPTTGVGHPSGMTAPMAVAPTGARTNTSWTDTNRGAPQGRTALVVGGIALLGVLVGGAFFALRGHAGATGESAPSAEPPKAAVAPAEAAPTAPPEIAPLVPAPAETAAPPSTPSAAPSSANRPSTSRPPPRPSVAAASAAPAPATAAPAPPPPAHTPAPAKTKNPLSIDLK
jgi:serine/threonine-protein kinase